MHLLVASSQLRSFDGASASSRRYVLFTISRNHPNPQLSHRFCTAVFLCASCLALLLVGVTSLVSSLGSGVPQYPLSQLPQSRVIEDALVGKTWRTCPLGDHAIGASAVQRCTALEVKCLTPKIAPSSSVFCISHLVTVSVQSGGWTSDSVLIAELCDGIPPVFEISFSDDIDQVDSSDTCALPPMCYDYDITHHWLSTAVQTGAVVHVACATCAFELRSIVASRLDFDLHVSADRITIEQTTLNTPTANTVVFIAQQSLNITRSVIHSPGGSIVLSGVHETYLSSSTIDVSHGLHAGTIAVGCSPSMSGVLAAVCTATMANSTVLSPSVSLLADAFDCGGAAGTIVVWSRGLTDCHATVSVTAHPTSRALVCYMTVAPRSRGGFIEVSSRGVLSFHGHAELSGDRPGRLLLDPASVVIGSLTTNDASLPSLLAATGPGSTYYLSPAAIVSSLNTG